MWIPPLSWLTTADPSTAFVVTAWNELFDPLTPDTFQPRLHNTSSLVSELLLVVERAEHSDQWARHIRPIKDEIAATAAAEHHILSSFPFYAATLDRLLKEESPRGLSAICKILEHLREEFNCRLMQAVRAAVSGMPSKKERMLDTLRSLATLAIQNGRQGEDVVIPESQGTLGSSCSDIAETLIDSATRGQEQFDCLFGIHGAQSDIQAVLRKVGFTLMPRRILQRIGIPSGGESDDQQHFVQHSATASSAKDAAKRGAAVIRPAIDVYNMYCNHSMLRLGQRVLWKRSKDVGYKAIDLDQEGFRKLSPRKNARTLTGNMLSRIEKNQVEPRLLNALELHSLAHGTTVPRVRLVNLWSAAECLSGTSSEKTVLQRVTKVFVPILVWRKTEKLVRYLAIASSIALRSGAATTLGSGFTSIGSKVDPAQCLLTLCARPNHPYIVELLRGVSAHPLLCFRAFKLWQQIHNPAILKRSLLNSERTIEWQLGRIYRARNLVVHDGMELPHLGVLLDNLQFYFSTAVSRIMHGLCMNVQWGTLESVALWQAKYEYYVDSLGKSPCPLTVGDVFSGEARGGSRLLWG